ncbi:MAG: GNAT family N-acetyltransferase [Muribaculaceae bacterium]|nr:GNAT family N-acetyltransferase [Muribaculaceae bacterium]
MKSNIRKAEEKDSPAIMDLLHQVNDIHADGRPDLFIHGCTKYTPTELAEIITNPNKPVFVAINEEGILTGYCFCVIEDHEAANNLRKVKTLYIDDLCVSERFRGQHIGQTIYGYVKVYAKENGFYNLTLNVWSRNPNAIRFYESLGMQIQKIGMEEII